MTQNTRFATSTRRPFVLVMIVGMVLAFRARTSPADGTPAGLNIGLGFGAHLPTEEDAYGDTASGSYPEVQLLYDISGVRLGPSFGYVYREQEETRRDYDISYIPAKLNIAILPIRFAKPDFAFQPYAGIGFGVYIPAGGFNEDDDLTVVAGNLGVQFDFSDWYNLSLDFAYNEVSGSTDSDYSETAVGDLSYSTVMLVNRFRIPFAKSR